jgi:N,N'-diacetyllegionaminate synthase
MKMKIIAEIGWNHMGDMQLAQKMIEAAAINGATHVKFQTWSTKRLKNGPWDNDGRKEIYQKAELSEEKHRFLLETCNKNNVVFFTSCFSSADVEFISQISNEIKIPSTELTNDDLIQSIVKNFSNKNNHYVYASTGTCTWEEISNAVDTLKKGKMNFSLLHCVSSYPTPAEYCNMQKIVELKKLHNDIGYSGHYFGIEDALVATELGATVIEKHFTIDRDLPGRDNKFALLPTDLKKLTDHIIVRQKMLRYHGLNFLQNESEMREKYRGRWDNKT